MADIITELRERSLRAEQDGEPMALLDEAADEIERLRQREVELLAAGDRLESQLVQVARERDRLRLTDAEREAVERAEGMTSNCDVAATLRGLLDRLGGCTPQLDCGAERKSVASQRCRDTGGQPFDSAPTTTLTACTEDGGK